MNGNTMKKYELQPTTLITPFVEPLFQVVALRDFGDVRKGDKGGYVESEDNLSHDGDCWIYDNARVFGKAWVFGNARVFDNAQIFDNARVYGNAEVFGDARVFDDAWVYGAECSHDNCPKCGEKL